ncbi:DGQHR domain-containing protein [Curtobacterium sp. RHCJP20]|uniref:DGQHR domain-containing protein n=1 Tax=Curtobacterium subtropicum TaxID=3055138 RepID=A0ABT7TG08_9MICO|nr:DGQHR domain-containing protein [Curtobacterium subtropicum]MDM7888517.1 DGQHR domain-containing protein [Curtobacterium subtropicum]
MIKGLFTEGAALKIEATKRLSLDVKESFRPSLVEELQSEGWFVDRQMIKSVRMRRPKAHDVAFEDRVWAMFARLGFEQLNKGRDFRLVWGESDNESRQVDVFAMDAETIVVVECKSSGAAQAPAETFKDVAEIIRGSRESLMRKLASAFPGRKVKFVLATNNFSVSAESIDRIEAMQIAYLDELAVDYYLELANHIGVAAKYQLLGHLFRGMKIPGLEGKVPAIRGRMGSKTYYSFMIEPERLLKLSYILHRSVGGGRSTDAYQRVIKKARLKAVQKFVDGGGFFPNSIVLNIDADVSRLRFDDAGVREGESRLGVLHLPQTYASAYVIDGQHRLYGFAGSKRADSELVPVVAFVDMSPSDQVQLFMQINENQQAVPKNLRNTLNSDLLWYSHNKREQAKALTLRVGQWLGEEKTSVLKGRVVLGEDKVTNLRCISLDAVRRGLDKGGFIGEFTASEMRRAGTFYRGSVEPTLRPLSTFLELAFERLASGLPVQWDLGKADGGFVFINNGVEALIRILGEIIQQYERENRFNAKRISPKEVFLHLEDKIDAIISGLSGLSAEEGAELKKTYGGSAGNVFWRKLQEFVKAADPEFEAEGLEEWQRAQAKQFNTESFAMIRDIETFLHDDVRLRLEKQYGASWWKVAVPPEVVQDAHALKIKKELSGENTEPVDWWDCLHLSAYHRILAYKQKIWDECFSADYTAPSAKRSGGSWKDKSSWMNELIRIRNTNSHEYSVTEDEHKFLVALHSWLGLADSD